MCKLTKSKQQGSTLLVVLMLLLVMMVLALSVAANSTSHAVITNNSVLQKQAYQAASSGSDVLLELMNTDATVVTSLRTNLCSSGFDQQFRTHASDNSTIINVVESVLDEPNDRRRITSAWFACVPAVGNDAAIVTCGANSKDCIAVVITGIACPAGTDVTNNQARENAGCVVSRHLQTYAVTGSK
ncbi:hypothetical protein [Entomomonas asaccharolytica]|uniref:Type 4 fimbrial biogenesis protein PilX N-terminal domain-containing protein n=1 Tax=Entomomonas asaccharolytica TaxID=2785331 RepID=A0A974NEE6_9GAMM|nr:hypothetical protein [Entomomonas asaccharolytica]QQP85153.1 hypothetical protein JHT90_12290 [Entomomonas asaccharolytica]